MSRIAKYPVELPKGVEITLGATEVAVKGPLGILTQHLNGDVNVVKDGDTVEFKI